MKATVTYKKELRSTQLHVTGWRKHCCTEKSNEIKIWIGYFTKQGYADQVIVLL